jgi:predicted transcriptional regulator
MGSAGEALKKVLATYSISQNKLATTMGVRRWDVGRWVHGHADPTGETIAAITKALTELDPAAAEAFIDQYLGTIVRSPQPDAQE